MDEKEALSWGSSFLKIFHLGEKGEEDGREHQICFFFPLFCFPLSFDGCISSSTYVLVSFLKV